MKYFVPLACTNKRNASSCSPDWEITRVSVRELGALYAAWRRADRVGKQRIVAEPLLFLRALSAIRQDVEGHYS